MATEWPKKRLKRHGCQSQKVKLLLKTWNSNDKLSNIRTVTFVEKTENRTIPTVERILLAITERTHNPGGEGDPQSSYMPDNN